MAFIIAVVVIVITVKLWLTVAGLFGLIKLIVTFSISQAWEAFKDVRDAETKAEIMAHLEDISCRD